MGGLTTPRTVLPGTSAFLPVSDLSREIAAGRRSPVDVTEEFLERIGRYDAELNAFASVYGEDARMAARAADSAIRSGHMIGPLHGVPIALKDLVEIEGRVTSGGSAHFRDRRSGTTATVARRLVAHGLIVIGKTQTVEFAYSGWGLNQHLGTPRNPWDRLRARAPGGSSSGSGVAVAAGLAPWAIGTDTGGSVRLPASFCGVTGFKPTIGRISSHGIMPLSRTLDTPGILSRDVLDAALLFNVLQGADPLDPNTRGIVPEDPLPTLDRGVHGLRLGRMPAAERDGVNDEVLAAYDAAIELLARSGATIVDVELPFRFTDCFAPHMTIVHAEAYAAHSVPVDDDATQLDISVREGIRHGRHISAFDYLAAFEERRLMREQLDCALSDVDALLTPTTETAAVPLDELRDPKPPSRFTRFVNTLEMCALALPNGISSDRLPLSMQVVCRRFEDAMALRIGRAYQRMSDHHLHVPELAP